MTAALLAPGAAIAAGWVSEVRHPAAPEGAVAQAAATDRHGRIVAVWTISTSGGFTILSSARDPSSGTWTAPDTLWSGTASHLSLDFELNDEGDGIVAWSRHESGDTFGSVHASLRSRIGVWTAPEAVTATSERGVDPDVALAQDGEAFVAWRGETWSGDSIELSLRSVDGSWSRQQLRAPDLIFSTISAPAIAVDGGGAATAAWTDSRGVFRTSRSPDGSWTAPTQFTTDSTYGAFEPRLVFGRAGEGLAVWTHGAHGQRYEIWVAAREGGLWGTPERLPSPRLTHWFDAVIAQGAAHVIWDTTTADGPDEIQTTSRALGSGGWAPHSTLSKGFSFGAPRLAAGANGDVVASWSKGFAPSYAYAARRPAGGSWEGETRLTLGPDGAGVSAPVIDPSGHVVLFLNRYPNPPTTFRSELAIFDVSPPEITSLSIPAQVKEDELATFSVAAADRWTAVGTPRWHIGYDGMVFHGTTHEWDYPQPGKYTVRVVVPDVAGNEAVVERTVEVLPAAGPPSPRPPVAVPRCRVPRLLGKTLAAARRLLGRAHCRLGKVTRTWSRRVRSGRVVRQTPRPGARLSRGARVSVVVSRGRRR